MNAVNISRGLQLNGDDIYSIGSSLYRQTASYIERCHLKDGGYFFAHILPSSAMDTYFAVSGLDILGAKPKRPRSIANYFLNRVRDGSLVSLNEIFAAVEVLNRLDIITDELREYGARIMSFQNEDGGFGAVDDIDIEVTSELEATCRAVTILVDLGINFDEQEIASFIFDMLNSDGGFGKGKCSTLATTYYATEIYSLLSLDTGKLINTKNYLRDKERRWQYNFIEDVFYLVESLANLNENTNLPKRAIEFVLACQRKNGGFARAGPIGIPTLEYTFYALSILREFFSNFNQLEDISSRSL